MDVSYIILAVFCLLYFPIWYPFIPAKPSYFSLVNPDIHEKIGPVKVYLNILLWLPFSIGPFILPLLLTLSTVLWFGGGITLVGILLVVLVSSGSIERFARRNATWEPSVDDSRYLKMKRCISFVCLICLTCGLSTISFKVIAVNVRQEKSLDDLVNIFLLWDYGIAILYMMYCGLILLLAKKKF